MRRINKYGVSRSRDKKGRIVKRELKDYTMCIHASVGGVERQCGCLLRKYMKKILNATKEGVCQAITAHYHKEGVSNIIGGGSSIILATAVIEYEDGIQNVPIPQGSK